MLVSAVALAALTWLIRSPSKQPQEEAAAPKAEPAKPAREAAIDRPPCRLTGTIEQGIATRVYVHSELAEVDLDAVLDADGKRFTLDLPETGPILVIASDAEGRTVERALVCGPEGVVRATLAFAKIAGEARLEGRCSFLETGAPAEGAIVRAKNEAKLFTAIADARGMFHVRAPAGRFSVACAKDMDESEAQSVLLAPNATVQLELSIAARASVLGVVVDAKQEPVEGAHVIARSARRGVESPERSETTDQEGRFKLRGLAPGAVTVQAEENGRFAEAEVVARAALPYAEVKLVLADRGLRIFGTIAAEDEEPIEGASVIVEAVGSDWARPRARIHRTVSSDQAGGYTAGGLVPGRYRVSASAKGFSDASEDVADLQAPVEVSMKLERACGAKVRVLPEAPATAVRVEVRESGRGPHRAPQRVLTGRSGELLAIEGMRGVVMISAESEGSVARAAEQAVDLCTANGPIELDLTPAAGEGALEVEVADKNGAPVADVEVEVHPEFRSAVTNAEGRALFEGLVAPLEHRVNADEGTSAVAKVEAGRTAHVKLVVDRSQGDVSGTVVAQGRAVEGAAIRAECGDSGRVRTLREAAIVARTDARGSFSFTPKDGSVCTVRAEHPQQGASEPVTLHAGSLPAWIELQSYASIDGRVVELATHRPVSPYTLSIRPLGRASELDERSLYVADPDGGFHADGLTPGAISIAVTSEHGRAHREVELPAGRVLDRVELTVFDEGTIVGRLFASNRPVTGARLEVKRVVPSARWGEASADTLASAVSAEDGSFALTVPAGDPMRVMVGDDRFYPWGSPPIALDSSGRPVDLGTIELQPRSDEREKEGGIGIMFAADPHGVRVIQFTDDSPAHDAGLMIGDVITAIDGTPAGRLPLVNWLVTLRGPPGTGVVLQIERGTSPRFEVTVVRRAIGLGAVPREP